MSKEVRIGLLALVAAAMLYLGFNFLKGTDFFSNSHTYYAVYDDVNGLTISNPVQLNGLQVGRVSDILILQNQGNKLLVVMDIRSDLDLGKETQAHLADNGLLGGKMIDLTIGKVDQPLAGEDTLISVADQGLIVALTDKTDPIINQIDSMTTKINRILSALDESTDDIQGSLKNFNSISASFNRTLSSGQLDQTLSNLNRLSGSLVKTGQEFEPLAGKMNSFADSLNQLELSAAVDKLNASMANLNRILAKVNDGEGTLGALANNDSLYNSLNTLTQSAQKLTTDLRENPKRYLNISVFGRKDKDEN